MGRCGRPHHIRTVVSAVLAEQREQAEEVAHKAVTAVLLSFGIDDDDRKEMKADFQHLRRWRKSVEQAQSLTFKAVVGTIVSGLSMPFISLTTSIHAVVSAEISAFRS
jgi:hypothetical protein